MIFTIRNCRLSSPLFTLPLMLVPAAGPVFGQAVRYRVTPITVPDCGTMIPVDLNDSGQVAAYFSTSQCTGMRWDSRTGEVLFVEDLPGGYVGATPLGMNNLGQIVGMSQSANGSEAFVWDEHTGGTGLGDLTGGMFMSYARGINNHGVICGWGSVRLRNNGIEAFRWTAEGGMVGLGDLPGGETRSVALAVNDAGYMVGFGTLRLPDTLIDRTEAVLWSPSGELHELGFLTELPTYSLARSINELGEVCGYSGNFDGGGSGFRWTAERGMLALNRLPDAEFSLARDINDRGEIVGESGVGQTSAAVLWDPSGAIHDLNELLDPCTRWTYLCDAAMINNAGQIVTDSPYHLGGCATALLTPYVVGDLDADGYVTVGDLVAQLAHMGQTVDAAYSDGDLDCDADVDIQDLSILLANFGESYP